ncbi:MULTISPECIES: L,D-transpeptidase family protein [Bacillus]|uniref:L,D-transpeptidase family protein n=1 Tax=Bacillus TaxID=1386 RepID=UPI0016536ADC|nr:MULTISPECIES: L,D-transpeptidase family protein [Bacillus]MDT0159596.1 L,D-transpeptidase family protein [Bacillus sp. AG4(2022)]
MEWLLIYHTVRQGETLTSISMDYRRPIAQLLAANPQISNPNQIFQGQRVMIPGLPEPSAIPYSISITLSTRRLSLLKNGILQKTYPVGIGKMLTQTPPGDYVIVNREPNPGGPFGIMWLSLSKAGYGIHGTNNPASIGKAVSKGCVRMNNQDVLELSGIVPNGTRVMIRN